MTMLLLAARWRAPISVANTLHAETPDAPENELTECTLGDRAMPVGALRFVDGFDLRRLITPLVCCFGSTIKRIWAQATILFLGVGEGGGMEVGAGSTNPLGYPKQL